MKKRSSETLYPVSLGSSVAVWREEQGFKPHVELTLEQLSEYLLSHDVRTKKDGPYFSRPMDLGDRSRSDQNAGAWRLIPVDIDELQREEVPALERWVLQSKLRCFLLTTFSHRPDRPKYRLLLTASRDIAANEHALVHRAIEAMVPFRIDPCMAKPSQPIFLPACPAEQEQHSSARFFEGEDVDIDRMLDAIRKDVEEERKRAEERAAQAKGTGVRQPGGLVEWFNYNYDLHALLAEKGYRRRSANRYVAPESKSGRAAVVVYEDRLLVSFHDPEHDPLAVRNKLHQARVLDSFAVYCKLEHSDDFDAAFKGAMKVAREAGWDGIAGPKPGEQSASPPPAPPVLFNAEDIYGSLKPQDFIVEGMLDAGSVVIASGDSNSGKTTILQLLSLQIALGQPFANKQTKQGVVLWVAGEDIENAKYRIVAMCEEYGIDPRLLGDSLLLLPQPIAILDADSMLGFHDSVRKRIGSSTSLTAVFIDSKSVNWGGADENSNDENAQLIAATRKFIVAPFGNPAAVFTHHLTKHREKEARSSRGAGSLINNADHEWRFEMNQEARVSNMMPGSKVRMERWAEQRFLIKTVELPEAKLPGLRNNFGEMPRVSIAEPLNKYNRSMKQLKQDTELRSVLHALQVLVDEKQDHGFSRVAQELGWEESTGKADYRRVKRVLDAAHKQKLVEKEGKVYVPNDAGRAYVAEDVVLEEGVDGEEQAHEEEAA